MICGSGIGSTSRLAKAVGAEPSQEMRDEKLHTCVVRRRFRSQKVKITSRPEDFWELRAIVARSAFRSQKCEKLMVPDHFWKFSYWKSARCCGAKHISKSKCIKHTILGALLEVETSKKCTCRRGAKHISKPKCTKHTILGAVSEVIMCSRVAGARNCAPRQKWAKREGFAAISKTLAGVGHLKRGSAKMHFAWQAQYNRHMSQTC